MQKNTTNGNNFALDFFPSGALAYLIGDPFRCTFWQVLETMPDIVTIVPVANKPRAEWLLRPTHPIPGPTTADRNFSRWLGLGLEFGSLLIE